MKQQYKKALALFVCIMLVLTGCSTAVKEQTETPAHIAKGRYVEQKWNLPEGVGTIVGMDKVGENQYMLMGNKNTENSLGTWFVWESTDGCKSWTELKIDWLEELRFSPIGSTTFVDKDTFYLNYDYYTEEIFNKLLTMNPEEDEEEMIEIQANSGRFAKATREEIIPYDDFFESEKGMRARDIRVLDDGFLGNMYFEFTKFSANDATPLFNIPVATVNLTGRYDLYNHALYAVDQGKIVEYSLETGELLREIPISGENKESAEQAQYFTGEVNPASVYVDKTSGEIYFADASGIYHIVGDTSLIEKVVDGSLTSLAIPSNQVEKLFYNEDNTYLVLTKTEQGSALYKYSYDENVPTVPTEELVVYSLEDLSSIRQVIGLYQLNNPTVKLTYKVGRTGEDSVTTADALKNLSTEILAGKGPDILVLDGMPIESYIDKGILLDLQDHIKNILTEEEHLENILYTYRNKDKMHAVPLRFTTSVIFGKNINSVQDIPTLTQHWKNNPNASKGYFVEFIKEFYPVIASEIFSRTGELKEVVLSEQLDILENLSKQMSSLEEESFVGYNDILMASTLFANDFMNMVTGEVKCFADFSYIYSGIRKVQEGTVQSFPNNNGGWYIPKVTMGVNSQSEKIDLALDFLTYSLSEEALASSFPEGLPVNKKALAANAKSPYGENDDGSYYGFTYNNEDGETVTSIELHVLWPEPEEIEHILSLIENLRHPSYNNAVVTEILGKELDLWLVEGTQTKEQTLQSIKNKLSIYLSE